MGRIFTWDEIQTNQVPTLEDFVKTKTEVASWAEEQLVEGNIQGLRFLGSVSRGTTSLRSDCDVAVKVAAEREWEFGQVARELQGMVRDTFHVGIEFMSVDKIVKEDITPLIAFHMLSSEPLEGNVVGENPLPHDAWKTNTTYRSEIESFVRLQRLFFSKMIPNSEESSVRALHASLDIVPRFAQKVKVARGIGADARKDNAYRQLHGILPVGLLLQVESQDAVNSSYDGVLGAAMRGEVGQEEYAQFIARHAGEELQRVESFFRDLEAPGVLESVLGERSFGEARGSSPMERR